MNEYPWIVSHVTNTFKLVYIDFLHLAPCQGGN